MTKRMLVDATHPEETRVAIVDDNRLEDFDFESASKKQLKGNIYLAKVVRIEPSLQAAFVEYGGNRHGFLPFSEIHPDYFRIPIADRSQEDEMADAEADEDFGDDESDVSDEAYAEEVRAYRAEMEGSAEEHIHIEHPVADESAAAVEPVSEPAQAEASTETLTVPAPVTAAEPPIPSFNEIAAPLTSMPDAPVAIEPVSVQQTAPAAPFGSDETHDLGLITDFGNAAVVEPAFPVPQTVETVGGEVAEEEQERVRVRRPRAPRYKIQEVVKRRQIMLIQVVKEERGNKGAALTTFLSLAGRYCVLMPNTDRGGGVSRKITSHQDRRRMKEILDQLETPEGMAVILRTAGMEQEPAEIQRDLEHLLRLWNSIREETLQSTAPTLIYEEANLIKRSIRDLYSADVSEVLVSGERGHRLAHDFMRSLMPEQVDRVKLYQDQVPLFFRYNVEKQIDQLYNPVVQLRSGGYIVINPTEALVSIDVNSGRATRERHIESTALKTNLEAADEVARQLRLRDLAGLVVIDFIDMEDGRNNAAVERRMKEAMKADRARLQIGRISPFGLMELSRQRLHPSLTELNFERCPHCAGVGLVRSVDSAAITVLRQIEEEGIRQRGGEMTVHVPTQVALYILNQKRAALSSVEQRYGLQVFLRGDDNLVSPDCKVERVRGSNRDEQRVRAPAVDNDQIFADEARGNGEVEAVEVQEVTPSDGERSSGGRRRSRYGRGRGRDRDRAERNAQPVADSEVNGNVVDNEQPLPDDNIGNVASSEAEVDGNRADGQRQDGQRQDGHRQGGRRRGRRGGRDGGREGSRDGERRFDRAPRDGGEGTQNVEAETHSSAPVSQPAQSAPAYVPPRSIHDLDTTPRDDRSTSSAPRAPVTPELPQPSTSVPYQVIEDATGDKPKGGWWRKLTGQ